MTPPRQFAGGIVTFYSFKGGVGRSMAVSNVGRLLARNLTEADRPTLLIDWDLEAPGLYRYFPEVKDSPRGLIDYLHDLVAALDDGFYADLAGGDRAQKLRARLPIEQWLTSTGTPQLRLLTAGATETALLGQYQKKVAAFDWVGLFYKYPFAIQAFREMLTEQFSYTLIDSRTGLSDTAGFCTAILPDRLVAMFAPNRQNESILKVVEAALEFRRMSEDYRPLIVFPLASRFDPSDLVNLQISLKTFQQEFSSLFERVYDLKVCDLTDYFADVVLLYVAHYSYGEPDVVDYEEPRYAGSLRRSYESFARWLVQRNEPWAPVPVSPRRSPLA